MLALLLVFTLALLFVLLVVLLLLLFFLGLLCAFSTISLLTFREFSFLLMIFLFVTLFPSGKEALNVVFVVVAVAVAAAAAAVDLDIVTDVADVSKEGFTVVILSEFVFLLAAAAATV
jgi:hypothetical protein